MVIRSFVPNLNSEREFGRTVGNLTIPTTNAWQAHPVLELFQ
jgi:hypothetical protein